MIDSELSEEISLNDFLLKFKRFSVLILKKWKLIFLVVLFGSLIGYIFSLFITPSYRAESKFLVKDYRPTSINGALASSLGFDINMIEDSRIYSNNTFIDLFKSRKVIENSLLKSFKHKNRQITFADYYIKLYGLNKKTTNKYINLFPVKADRNQFSRRQDSILNIIYNNVICNNLSIKRFDKNQSLFIAEVKSIKEDFSINFLGSIFEVILNDFKLMKTKNINVLKQRVDSLKQETNTLLIKKQSSTLLTDKTNLFFSETDKYDLDFDLNIKLLTKLTEQLEISKLNLFSDSQLIQIVDSSSRPLTDERTSSIFIILISGIISGAIFVFVLLLKKALGLVRN